MLTSDALMQHWQFCDFTVINFHVNSLLFFVFMPLPMCSLNKSVIIIYFYCSTRLSAVGKIYCMTEHQFKKLQSYFNLFVILLECTQS